MKIGVLIATYNGEKFIKEQLDSIINQTTPVDEIIISDDGSTDGTLEIILEYIDKYDKINMKLEKIRVSKVLPLTLKMLFAIQQQIFYSFRAIY